MSKAYEVTRTVGLVRSGVIAQAVAVGGCTLDWLIANDGDFSGLLGSLDSPIYGYGAPAKAVEYGNDKVLTGTPTGVEVGMVAYIAEDCGYGYSGRYRVTAVGASDLTFGDSFQRTTLAWVGFYGTNIIKIGGDFTTYFTNGDKFVLDDSSNAANDVVYTVSSVAFNTPNTEITVVETISDDTATGGYIMPCVYCVVGGAFDSIDNADAAMNAGSYDATILTNVSETITAKMTVSGGNILKNTWKRILGYNTSVRMSGDNIISDMARGETYYQGAYATFQDGVDVNCSVELDTSGSSIDHFDFDGSENYILENLYMTNGSLANEAFVSAAPSENVIVRNCKFDNLADVHNGDTIGGFVLDDCWCGENIGLHAISLRGHDSMVFNCVFENTTAGKNAIAFLAFGGVVYNCLFFKLGQFGVRITTGAAVLVMNCTFYRCVSASLCNDGSENIVAYNNVIMTSVGDEAFYSRGSGGGSFIHDHNCVIEYDGTPAVFGQNDGAGGQIAVAAANDILVDPLYEDAENKNFRLKTNSPCLGTGKPTMSGSKTNMGCNLEFASVLPHGIMHGSI